MKKLSLIAIALGLVVILAGSAFANTTLYNSASSRLQSVSGANRVNCPSYDVDMKALATGVSYDIMYVPAGYIVYGASMKVTALQVGASVYTGVLVAAGASELSGSDLTAAKDTIYLADTPSVAATTPGVVTFTPTITGTSTAGTVRIRVCFADMGNN